MRRVFVGLFVLVLLLCVAAPADADLTAFIGTNATPSNRPVKGFGVGLSLLVLGFEFEYSDTAEDEAAGAPGLRTGMFNLLVQTPFGISGLQFYGTVGGGLFQERGSGLEETNAGGNAGVGVKIAVAGPIRMRLDYRVFTLRGAPQHDTHQRLYAGLNLGF
jgi:opacity protein-like surface antigen